MSFERSIVQELRKWKVSEHRKPLVLRGARQVGKTTVIKEFARDFDTFIYLNLEKEDDRELFNNSLDAKKLFQFICIEKNVSPAGETLLFIDEIQHSPNAVMQMRYFYEDVPDLFVISAGSLLEIMMDMHRISFPVGRVEYRYLYPMTFEEFLLALDEQAVLDLYRTVPVPQIAHHRLSELFRLYTFVGGMPEAVARYTETRDLSQVSDVYEALFSAFKDDVSKYARNESETNIIRHVIETAPAETGNRIAFEKFGNSGYKSKEIGNALRTLERAMLLYLRYPVTEATLPFMPDLKLRPHLQFLDSGMLNHALGIAGWYFKGDSLSDIYGGKLAEQIVGQELLAANDRKIEKPLFWTREKKQSNAEVDFLFTKDGTVYPVEVKSGKTGTLRSLHSYLENSDCTVGIRLYSGEYSIEQAVTPVKRKPYTLINLPLYCAGRLGDYISTCPQGSQ